MLASIPSLGLPAVNLASMSASEEEFLLKAITIVGGFFIATLFIVLKTVRVVMTKRATELTKREIAAYVAEGSIRPEDAAVLINSGADAQVEKITAAVAAGIISPSKAEKLIASLRNERCAAGSNL